MKMLFALLAIVVALVLAHNYIQTGEIGFGSTLSDTSLEIRSLDERLTDAMRAYRIAGRGSALGGLEGGSRAESALGEVRFVEREIDGVRQKLSSDKEREMFAALEQHLREAKRELGLQ